MKLLFVQDAVRFHPLPRLLRILGIDYEVAYFTGDLQTPQGNIAWNNDNAIRNYLRQFDAVLVGIRGNMLNSTVPIFRSFRWLGWNDPEDPPVAYIGLDPRAGYADMGALPSDFPILRPNSSDPAGTLFAFTTGSYATTAGLRVRLHRENVELYTNCAILQATTNFGLNDGYLYRLDLAKHAALGGQGEILATPVSEDITFPSDVVCAYRYKNRYLLPMSLYTNTQNPSMPIPGMFWVFYALKLLGIQPRYAVPLFLVMDDALMLYFPPSGNPAGLPTYAQFARIGYETYRYLAEVFYPRTGCAMVCGLLTGGRYRSAAYGEHWRLVMNAQWSNPPINLDSETHGYILQWHNLLLRHHYGALPCTIHDHTISPWANRTFSSFARHSDAGFPHAAPNDVPITRGATLVKADTYAGTPPADARERTIGGERYYEWGFTTSGTSATISSLTPNNLYGARVLYETAVAEMRAYGFPDAHGGDDYRLLITPEGHTGDPSVWRVWKELGYQLVRNRVRSVHTPPDTNPLPIGRAFEGLHFATYENTNIDAVQSAFQITLGLYHPDNPGLTATAKWGLDLSGDISGLWGTDRSLAARRVYRRAIGAATEAWLQTTWGLHLLAAHPNVIIGWADPADPVRPFDPNDPRVSINFLLEVAWNMEKIVNVLYPYLKFGTVKEYVAMRERLLST